MSAPKTGTIGWMDLTVANAPAVRDFYKAVVGWDVTPVSMGDYEDYCMVPPGGGDPVAGVCHARGANEGIPPVWMAYIIVEDLDKSLASCSEHGGSIVFGPKKYGDQGAWCAVRDPAGAVFALFQPRSGEPG
jgi:predicted enzyme related to lactoylglutathione lyase